MSFVIHSLVHNFYYNVHLHFSIADKWKSDIDRLAKDDSSYSYSDLASSIGTYLKDNYPDVSWVVVVYEPVTGWDKHTMIGWDYYHLFRYYDHNIVVGRFLTPPPYRDIGLSSAFSSAFSSDCVKFFHFYIIKPMATKTYHNLNSQGWSIPLLFMLQGGHSYSVYGFLQNGRALMMSSDGEGHQTLASSQTDESIDIYGQDSRVYITTMSSGGCSGLAVVLAQK